MKLTTLFSRVTLCALFSASLLLQSQTVSREYKNAINPVFAGMDLSRVPHHLLKDYAMEFIELEAYNGIVNDTNFVHKGTYTAAYNTLVMARTQLQKKSAPRGAFLLSLSSL